MKPQEIRFQNATLDLLEDTFDLNPIFPRTLPTYTKWIALAEEQEITPQERENLDLLLASFEISGAGWNEVELESMFIAPLFMLLKLHESAIGYFMERPLSAEVESIKLYGIVDAAIAKGRRAPKTPYFCMQEFKRSQEYKGRADGQTLAAMLAAQAVNENQLPIYGLYVVGAAWNFMVLEGKDYVVSPTYGADGKGIFKVFKILKALKALILKQVEEGA